MKKNNLVSIIIPCYNQAQYLETSVQSAIEQTYPDIEVIIVNDGSLDNTQEVAIELQKKHPHIIRIITQKNQGLSQARNTGIKESLGEYILPLDADDRIAASMLSKSIEVLTQNNADIVSTDGQSFGVKTHIIRSKEFPECKLLYSNCMVATSLYRYKVWMEIGGYKKNMKEGYEDWEFWVNAYKHGFKFKHCPEILFYYRRKEVSMYTESLKKDTYLRAKIIMNHPELYLIPQVQEAMTNIKETEGLADLYFYYSKDLSLDTKYLIKIISLYLVSNKLEENQLINISDSNKKIGLYSLDIIENHKKLKQIYKEVEADFILLYAPMRYEVESLQNSHFAWKKNTGILNAHGTLFPFTLNSDRENPKKQLIAYQRLIQYQTKMINEKDSLINKLKKSKKQQQVLMASIRETTKLSLLKQPFNKYKAYKMMLKTYFTIKKPAK